MNDRKLLSPEEFKLKVNEYVDESVARLKLKFQNEKKDSTLLNKLEKPL